MGDKGCILLVDDDPNMAMIARKVFTRAGFRFLAAETAHRAFELIDQEKPDLVMLDYMLPDMDGEEFLRKYQDYGPDRAPIVMLTCRADKNDRMEDYFELGLSAFLVKPFGHRELVAITENLIHRARFERKRRGETPVASVPFDGEGLDDLGTTAQSIEALAYSLLNGADGELSDRQKVTVTAIYNGCRRLQKILKRLRAPGEEAAERVREVEFGS